ncbi:tetratricopeptide repeat protein [Crocinitomicaceae bacterium]|jgi:Ca-activated chloride channel family protein|nr:tetratricopeptide repeat protein [Crocinitomicaceae bacterium]MDC1195749.1 tetratricopeptide repeat protein [Crocinitomicaceae bacterium]MDC1283054.1 tetratricopeptide repeat protein [Crocinitomicaceae bacterium]|tara:strand:- start:7296 stop:8021 length:726 start_codon:yes stop_codon:yes gene_type:complete
MKAIFIIGFLLSTVVSFSQEWRDPLGLARKEYKNENYEKALKYYKSAQKKAPEDVNLSDEIGQSAYKSGDYETAEKVFQQNSANKRSNKNRAKNIHNIGNARMRTKNYKGAVEAYKDALRLNPEDEKTRYNLSEATRKLKKKKKEKEKSQKNQDEKKKEKPKSEEKKDDNDKKGNKKPGEKKPEGDKKGQGNKSKNQNKSQLPNKTVDRMLDELMKKEAKTKGRMARNGVAGFTPRSGKDW